MSPNPGHCPSEAIGKRVRVQLRNGVRPDAEWPADGRLGCRWSLTGHPYDITRYEVAK